MATLKDICIIPQRLQQMHEHYDNARKNRMQAQKNYAKCMAQIDAMGAEGLTRICEGKRIRKRCKSHVNNGTIPERIVSVRGCVCRTKMI